MIDWAKVRAGTPLTRDELFEIVTRWRECVEVHHIPMNALNVSQVTDMSRLFSGMGTFNEPIGDWDVSQVTDMADMFYRASAFNQPLASWSVQNVNTMYGMFARATSFNQPLDTWHPRVLRTTYSMFRQATSFNQPIFAIPNSVVVTEHMFHSAARFNQPVVGDFSNVRFAQGMFARAYAFNQPVDWGLVRCEVTSMFQDAIHFNQSLHRLLTVPHERTARSRLLQGAYRLCKHHVPLDVIPWYDNTEQAVRIAMDLDNQETPPLVLPLSKIACLLGSDLRWIVAEWLGWRTPDEWLDFVTKQCLLSGNLYLTEPALTN